MIEGDDVPVRRVAWREEEDGCVMLVREWPRGSGLAGLRARVAWLLSPRRVKLDERGSLLWRHLDGATTVAGLARILERERPDDASDAGARVARWLGVLAANHLIELRRGR